MRLHPISILVGWLLMVGLSLSVFAQDDRSERKTLTIWLIPSELAADPKDQQTVEEFNREVSKDDWVTVLNTSVPQYKYQLEVWNQEFAIPNFPIIKGQSQTIAALRRFAEKNLVHINVRFVWWGQAFEELRAITEGKQSPKLGEYQIAPDVAQIGSTWTAFFAAKEGVLAQGTASDGCKWRDVENPAMSRAALRYTTDARLIFYWKKNQYADKQPPFYLDASSWDTILSSIRERVLLSQKSWPPLAFPIALTPNILHDYAPLCWAGGGDIINDKKRLSDFASEKTLSVPRKLMQNVTFLGPDQLPRRILTFPEISHEEAVKHFFDGEYCAIIEPAVFIKRWQQQIKEKNLPTDFLLGVSSRPNPESIDFWEYAGVAVPPNAFIGGSDLIIFNRSASKEKSLDLARFLAKEDSIYTKLLAELGHLPAQLLEENVEVMSESLGIPHISGSSSQGNDFINALRVALNNQKKSEYPSLDYWPENFESSEFFEEMQKVWRAISKGNSDGRGEERLRAASARAELLVNRNIDTSVWFWEEVKQWSLLIIGLGAFGLLILAFNQVRLKNSNIRVLKKLAEEEQHKNKALEKAALEGQEKVEALEKAASQEKGRLLALRLYRSKIHEQLHAYGARVIELIRSDNENKMEILFDYGHHIATVFNKHLASIVKKVTEELENPHAPMGLRVIAQEAYQGAEIEFKASQALPAPATTLILNQQLDDWSLERFPHLLIVVLHEWFYNCLKEVAVYLPSDPKIEVNIVLKDKQICLSIISPLPISATAAATLGANPSDPTKKSGEGLPLIRDLLWYGFETKAYSETISGGRAIITFPINLTRRTSQ